VRNYILLLALLALCPALVAQQTLNNDAVIKLANAGLSEDLIVSTINSQAGTYDTSTDGLIALKAAGLSDNVVSAMVAKASIPTPAKPAACSEDGPIPGLPCVPGVYYKGPAGWVKLEQTSASGTETEGGAKSLIPVVGLFNHVKGVESFPGARAQLQITEQNPAFYVRTGRSETTFAAKQSAVHGEILQLEEKKGQRNLQVASAGTVSVRSGYDQKSIREITITKTSADIYQIMPKAELGWGEYILNLGGKYDFGIHPGK
jgi:hypothetical protein